jgi:hypothetical protein
MVTEGTIKRGAQARLVRDGNGQPALLTRVAQAEFLLRAHTDNLADLGQNLNSIATAKVLSKSQVLTGVIGMIITAVLSLGAILAQMMR